jgi:hypothetical protein
MLASAAIPLAFGNTAHSAVTTPLKILTSFAVCCPPKFFGLRVANADMEALVAGRRSAQRNTTTDCSRMSSLDERFARWRIGTPSGWHRRSPTFRSVQRLRAWPTSLALDRAI